MKKNYTESRRYAPNKNLGKDGRKIIDPLTPEEAYQNSPVTLKDLERYHMRPGEIWLVSGDKAPDTVLYSLIGFVPIEWEQQRKMCRRFPYMHSHLKYGDTSLLSEEIMDHCFQRFRYASPMDKREWTVNFVFDWHYGTLQFIKPIAFADWVLPDQRVEMKPLPKVNATTREVQYAD